MPSPQLSGLEFGVLFGEVWKQRSIFSVILSISPDPTISSMLFGLQLFLFNSESFSLRSAQGSSSFPEAFLLLIILS